MKKSLPHALKMSTPTVPFCGSWRCCLNLMCCRCLYDVDGDDAVTVSDVLVVLSAFASCS